MWQSTPIRTLFSENRQKNDSLSKFDHLTTCRSQGCGRRCATLCSLHIIAHWKSERKSEQPDTRVANYPRPAFLIHSAHTDHILSSHVHWIRERSWVRQMCGARIPHSLHSISRTNHRFILPLVICRMFYPIERGIASLQLLHSHGTDDIG